MADAGLVDVGGFETSQSRQDACRLTPCTINEWFVPQTKDKPQEGSADSSQVYALASCPYIGAQIITNVIPRVPDYSSSIMCPKTLF